MMMVEMMMMSIMMKIMAKMVLVKLRCEAVTVVRKRGR